MSEQEFDIAIADALGMQPGRAVGVIEDQAWYDRDGNPIPHYAPQRVAMLVAAALLHRDTCIALGKAVLRCDQEGIRFGARKALLDPLKADAHEAQQLLYDATTALKESAS